MPTMTGMNTTESTVKRKKKHIKKPRTNKQTNKHKTQQKANIQTNKNQAKERKNQTQKQKQKQINIQTNSFWVRLHGYVSFKSTLMAIRKKEKEKVGESSFINDRHNSIFLIILSLQHESCVFYPNNLWATYHLFTYSF